MLTVSLGRPTSEVMDGRGRHGGNTVLPNDGISGFRRGNAK